MLRLKSELTSYILTSRNNEVLLDINTSFFNHSEEYGYYLHKEIFDFVYYSKGRFTFTEIYNMPIVYRRGYIKMLSDTLQKESDEAKKASRKGSRR